VCVCATVTADVSHNDTSSSSSSTALHDDSPTVARPSSLHSPRTSHEVSRTSQDVRPTSRSVQRRSIRKTSVVGSSVVLDCDVPPPPPALNDLPPSSGRRPRPPAGDQREYMVKWHKQGVEVSTYSPLIPPSHSCLQCLQWMSGVV